MQKTFNLCLTTKTEVHSALVETFVHFKEAKMDEEAEETRKLTERFCQQMHKKDIVLDISFSIHMNNILYKELKKKRNRFFSKAAKTDNLELKESFFKITMELDSIISSLQLCRDIA